MKDEARFWALWHLLWSRWEKDQFLGSLGNLQLLWKLIGHGAKKSFLKYLPMKGEVKSRKITQEGQKEDANPNTPGF